MCVALIVGSLFASFGCANYSGRRPYTVDPVGVFFDKSGEKFVTSGEKIVVRGRSYDVVTIGDKRFYRNEVGTYTLFAVD
ncbi:MAG: hypothetical protein ACOVMP_09675 [Chthoniobacterales bacterium]